MTSDSISISIIMPAYNEEKSIVSATRQNMKTFSSMGVDYEIIIVDDHSIDRTGIVGKELAEKYQEVTCYHHDKNLGPGGAFRTGVCHAIKKYVMFIPFDNALTPEDLEPYLPRIGVCDIVVGVRAERVGYSNFAKFASFFYNRIFLPILFDLGVSDANWIQVYRRCHFEDGTLKIGKTRIFFLVEILVQARINKLIIAEIPSRMYSRVHGLPTCTRFSVMWITFWDAIRFFIKINKGF